MPSRVDDLLQRMAQLEREVEAELHRTGERWRYGVDAGRVRFERDVGEAHRRLKQGIPRFLRESSPLTILVAPLLYSLVLPIALLDLWVTIYQRVCFPVFGIRLVRRSAYVVIDRQHLAYLNTIEKVNCMYCGYANGVFAYVREVGGRTEQYRCPIRHAKAVAAPHAHYREFVDFGDASGYRQQLPLLRARLKTETQDEVSDEPKP